MNQAITYRVGYRRGEGRFPGSCREAERAGRAGGVQEAAEAGADGGVLDQAAALADRHGGVQLGALLGARCSALRPRGSADAAGLREGLRQAQQDRRASTRRRSARRCRGRPCASCRSRARPTRRKWRCTASAPRSWRSAPLRPTSCAQSCPSSGSLPLPAQRGLSDLLTLVETEAERFKPLPVELRLVLTELARQWRGCDEVVRRMDREIALNVRQSPRAMRLTFVPGIGPIGASVIDAMLPNPNVFKSGRHFAAYVRAHAARGQLRQDGPPRARSPRKATPICAASWCWARQPFWRACAAARCRASRPGC